MPAEHNLDQQITDHINRFQDWLDLSQRSKANYGSSIRRFYHLSARNTPINPDGLAHRNTAGLTDALAEHITSDSMKYAMQKYFDWLQQRAPTEEDERTILFLKNKVESQDPSTEPSDIGEKVLSQEKVRELCIKTPQRPRSHQDQIRLLLQLMYDTATRISGMLWLEWQDIWRTEYEGRPLDDRELLIHCDRSKSKESGVVELTEDTCQRLRDYEDRVNPTDSNETVFFTDLKEQSAYQKLYRNFKTQAAKSGVPDASPHWFRHSRLTHLGMEMLDEGKSYPEIKERLRRYGRHRSGETTEIYIKILKNRRAESVSQYSTIDWSG